METIIRKRFSFNGWVQGVGFRYSACRAAEAAGVTGWVRNEYDGSVTMEAQGSEAQIDRLIFTLTHDRYIRIDRTDCRSVPIVSNKRGFRVRY